MVKLIIIADDYTGALDTGVQFAKNSIETFVILYNDLDLKKVDEGIQVVVVSTESRHISKDIAASRVKEVGKKALEYGIQFFYKKTDSALRGNIGSELYALVEAINENGVMFIPAYPDSNRTTLDGCQFVNGIPVNETTYARDPIDPVRSKYIPDIIRLQENVRVVVINKGNMNTSCVTDDEKTIYVFDAEKNRDMSDIAKFLKQNGKLRLTAGCAGFANTLIEVLEFEKNQGRKKRLVSGRMLTVSGSLNEISLEQIKLAEKNNFCSITLKPEHKLQMDLYKSELGIELVNKIIGMLDAGKDIIIKTVDSVEEKEDCREFAKKAGIDEGSVPALISRNIGGLIKEITKRTQLGTLVVFGGDTTLEIVNAMEFSGIIPNDEIMPGVVLSEPIGKGEKFNFITKSGGLGEKNVLPKIKEYMSAADSNSDMRNKLF